VLAAAAVLLPLAVRHGTWGAALFGAGLMAATLAVAPGASTLGLVLCAWATALGLATRANASEVRTVLHRLWSGPPPVARPAEGRVGAS
jgi:hypothetical protein